MDILKILGDKNLSFKGEINNYVIICNHWPNITHFLLYDMVFKSVNGNVKKRIAFPLLFWGAINMIAGIFYLLSSSDLIRGVLLQAFFWGLIDGIIGLVSYLSKKEIDLEKVKKILLINVYLDNAYLIIGVLLILLGSNAFIIGNGYGVIIQGLFLLIVDIVHHTHIKKILK